jgi:hypothetical protein
MNSGTRSDWASGAAGAMMGLGILTFALFPFALPLLILTFAAALPFILPLVAVAMLAAILRGVWLGIRAAGRGMRRLPAASTRQPGLQPVGCRAR